MRPLTCYVALPTWLFLCIAASFTFAQDRQVATPEPSAAAGSAAPPFDSSKYLPLCSTEKVNGDCFVNIDRRYPMSMPAYQMHRNSHITVYVFHPFAFEALTLDAGTAQAFEGSDQAAALVTAAVPIGKGASWGMIDSALTADKESITTFTDTRDRAETRLSARANQPSDVALAKEILQQLQSLSDLLTQTLAPVPHYFAETKSIYAQIREIESTVPRPVADVQNTVLRGPGVPSDTPNPWEDYPTWREYMRAAITKQGDDTTEVLELLPGPCQKVNDPPPSLGPWLPRARRCKPPNTTTQSSPLSDNYDALYKKLQDNLALLPADKPDPGTYQQIMSLKTDLDQRKQHVSQVLSLLAGLIAKITPDMQSLRGNIALARDVPSNPVKLGVIPGPSSPEKILAPYKALAPQSTYTVNAQNEIANPLLGLPTSTQKQAIVTITALYVAPRFEVSAGAFLSWLPNRTFSNYKDVTLTGGVPAPADVKIDMTKTIPPLVIPFVAANYRISPEFTWPGGRRGAVYATAGIALNPYDTQVEYAAGFSVSWRYLMFSPLFHLGHSTHLTQGEQVGQIWCQYGNSATATPTPPACGGGTPAAPSTKAFWTGAFALGISVRVPTTFSSANH
ncbi:MAG: hypothetical protein ABSB23_04005 [Bryobacteraceae bacterium]